MPSMKVARLYDSTDIRFEDDPIPAVGPGEALVKTRTCGICSGDVMGWYMKKKAPLVFGHEPAGEIVEIGEGVADFQTWRPSVRPSSRPMFFVPGVSTRRVCPMSNVASNKDCSWWNG